MGFFSDLFGGTDDSAQREQQRSNLRSEELTERLAQQARDDVLSLFGPAQEAGQAGFGAALDVFRESIPAQFGAFQTGNRNARSVQSAGLEQIQNAILGKPVDFSSLSAGRQPIDASGFTIPQLPQFQFSDQVRGSPSPQQGPLGSNLGNLDETLLLKILSGQEGQF